MKLPNLIETKIQHLLTEWSGIVFRAYTCVHIGTIFTSASVFTSVMVTLIQIFTAVTASISRVAATLVTAQIVSAGSVATRPRGTVVNVHMATISRPAGVANTAKLIKQVFAPCSVSTRIRGTNGGALTTHGDLRIPHQVELGGLRGLAVVHEGQVHPSDSHRSQAAREPLTDGHRRLLVGEEPNAPAAMGRAAGVGDPIHRDGPGREGLLLSLGHRHGHAMPAPVGHQAYPTEGHRLHASCRCGSPHGSRNPAGPPSAGRSRAPPAAAPRSGSASAAPCRCWSPGRTRYRWPGTGPGCFQRLHCRHLKHVLLVMRWLIGLIVCPLSLEIFSKPTCRFKNVMVFNLIFFFLPEKCPEQYNIIFYPINVPNNVIIFCNPEFTIWD